MSASEEHQSDLTKIDQFLDSYIPNLRRDEEAQSMRLAEERNKEKMDKERENFLRTIAKEGIRKVPVVGDFVADKFDKIVDTVVKPVGDWIVDKIIVPIGASAANMINKPKNKHRHFGTMGNGLALSGLARVPATEVQRNYNEMQLRSGKGITGQYITRLGGADRPYRAKENQLLAEILIKTLAKPKFSRFLTIGLKEKKIPENMSILDAVLKYIGREKQDDKVTRALGVMLGEDGVILN